MFRLLVAFFLLLHVSLLFFLPSVLFFISLSLVNSLYATGCCCCRSGTRSRRRRRTTSLVASTSNPIKTNVLWLCHLCLFFYDKQQQVVQAQREREQKAMLDAQRGKKNIHSTLNFSTLFVSSFIVTIAKIVLPFTQTFFFSRFCIVSLQRLARHNKH